MSESERLSLALVLVAAIVAMTCSCSGAAAPFVTVPVTVHCQRYDLSASSDGSGSGAVETTQGGEVDEDGEVQHATVRHRRAGRGALIVLDNDCTMQVSPSTSPSTTGNRVTTGDVSPSVPVTVTP